MMTRTEIDEALAHLIKLGSHPPSPPGDSWMVAILARVVADQEQRLRGLEDVAGKTTKVIEAEVEGWRSRAIAAHAAGDMSGHAVAVARCDSLTGAVAAIRGKVCFGAASSNAEPAEHPAMALLREIEWSGEDNVCPSCGEYGPHPTLGGGPTPGTHRAGCKLAALINGGAP